MDAFQQWLGDFKACVRDYWDGWWDGTDQDMGGGGDFPYSNESPF
jgi:hypothetical protein